MDKFEIRGKIEQKPKNQSNVLFLLIRIMLIIEIGSSLVSMLGGITPRSAVVLIISIMLLIMFRPRKQAEGAYVDGVYFASFNGPLLVISFRPARDRKVEIAISSISTLQYSKNFQYLGMICDYKGTEGKKTTTQTQAQLRLHLSYAQNEAFLDRLQRETGRTIAIAEKG